MALKKLQTKEVAEAVAINERESDLLTALAMTEKNLNKMLDKKANLEEEIKSTQLTLQLIEQELLKLEEGE